eukprot:g404.t1
MPDTTTTARRSLLSCSLRTCVCIAVWPLLAAAAVPFSTSGGSIPGRGLRITSREEDREVEKFRKRIRVRAVPPPAKASSEGTTASNNQTTGQVATANSANYELSPRALADDASPPYFDFFDEIAPFLHIPEIKVLNDIITVSVSTADSYVVPDDEADESDTEQRNTTGIASSASSPLVLQGGGAGGVFSPVFLNNYAGFTSGATITSPGGGEQQDARHFAFRSAMHVQIGFDSWMELFGELGDMAADAVGEKMNEAWDRFEEKVEIVQDGIEDAVQGVRENLAADLAELGEWTEDVGEKLGDWKDNVGDKIGDWKEDVVEWKEDVGEKLGDWKDNVGNRVDDWKDNVENRVEAVEDRMEDAADRVQDWAEDKFGWMWGGSGSGEEEKKDKDASSSGGGGAAASTSVEQRSAPLPGARSSGIGRPLPGLQEQHSAHVHGHVDANRPAASRTTVRRQTVFAPGAGNNPMRTVAPPKSAGTLSTHQPVVHLPQQPRPGTATPAGSGYTSPAPYPATGRAPRFLAPPVVGSGSGANAGTGAGAVRRLSSAGSVGTPAGTGYSVAPPVSGVPGSSSSSASDSPYVWNPTTGTYVYDMTKINKTTRTTTAAPVVTSNTHTTTPVVAPPEMPAYCDGPGAGIDRPLGKKRGKKIGLKKNKPVAPKHGNVFSFMLTALGGGSASPNEESNPGGGFLESSTSMGSPAFPLQGSPGALDTDDDKPSEEAEAELDDVRKQKLVRDRGFSLFGSAEPAGAQTPASSTAPAADVEIPEAAQEVEAPQPVLDFMPRSLGMPASQKKYVFDLFFVVHARLYPEATSALDLYLEVSSFKVNDVLLDDNSWLKPVWRRVYPFIDAQLQSVAASALQKWMAENENKVGIISWILSCLGAVCTCCGKV